LSDKTFAPGYGEFSSAHAGDLEALAVAVPADAVTAPLPGELRTLLGGAYAVSDLAAARRWPQAAAVLRGMTAAWDAHRRGGGVPPRLVGPTSGALQVLARAVAARDAAKARNAALDVAQAALDLQLRYLPPVQVDRARADLWARQVVVDGAARDSSGVASDVATIEWIRDRIARAFDSVDMTRIDARLNQLRANVGDEDLPAAARTAAQLRKALAQARPVR
jgi:hypothetical protein